jgi:hypothetical protein
MVDDARRPDEEVQDEDPVVAHRISLQTCCPSLQSLGSALSPAWASGTSRHLLRETETCGWRRRSHAMKHLTCGSSIVRLAHAASR